MVEEAPKTARGSIDICCQLGGAIVSYSHSQHVRLVRLMCPVWHWLSTLFGGGVQFIWCDCPVHLAAASNCLVVCTKANELHYKSVAVNYWGDALARLITLEKTIGTCTFVSMPGSKPIGHPEHDDRIGKVLARMAMHRHGVDVGEILKQGSARAAQHAGGGRKSPTEICETLQIDYALMPPPLSPTIFIVDDVITLIGSIGSCTSVRLM